MMDTNTFLKNYNNKIVPSKKFSNSIKNTSEILIKLLKKNIKNIKSIRIVGSLAKDTYIPDKCDIDIFITINANEKIIFFNQIKKLFKTCEIINHSFPYIKLKFKSFFFDLIPLDRVPTKKHIISNTPAHVTYVKSKKPNTIKIRILKFFLILHGLYGANTKIGGFSGYACEVLVIKYKTLEKIFTFLSLNITKKFLEDPVIKDRNLLASICDRSFYYIKILCYECLNNKTLLTKPLYSLKWFFELENRIVIKNEFDTYYLAYKYFKKSRSKIKKNPGYISVLIKTENKVYENYLNNSYLKVTGPDIKHYGVYKYFIKNKSFFAWNKTNIFTGHNINNIEKYKKKTIKITKKLIKNSEKLFYIKHYITTG